VVPLIAAPRRLSPPGEAGGAVVPLRRRRAGGTGRRWRGARELRRAAGTRGDVGRGVGRRCDPSPLTAGRLPPAG